MKFIALFARQKPENIWHTVETGDLSEDKFYGRSDQSPETEVLPALVASRDRLDTTELFWLSHVSRSCIWDSLGPLLDFLCLFFLVQWWGLIMAFLMQGKRSAN